MAVISDWDVVGSFVNFRFSDQQSLYFSQAFCLS